MCMRILGTINVDPRSLKLLVPLVRERKEQIENNKKRERNERTPKEAFF